MLLLLFCCSVIWPSATPWTTAHQSPLSFTISQTLLKLMSIELVMPANHLILYCPLLLLPSVFPSIRVFSNESALRIRWPKYWSFSFSINPSNEYSGLVSFRIEQFCMSNIFWHTILKKIHRVGTLKEKFTFWEKTSILITLYRKILLNITEEHLIKVM